MRKKKQQEETKEALLLQMKEKGQSPTKESEAFLEIGEAEKLALKAHAKKCTRCGRLIEELGVTKLAKLKRQGALHQNDPLAAS